MALKPEFICLLRDIRDRIYPDMDGWYDEINTIYADIKIIEQNITAMKAYLDNLKVEMEEIRDQIFALHIGEVLTIPNEPNNELGDATASIDPLTSKLDLGIPAGIQGEAATLNVGTTETSTPGSSAEVTNSGTELEAIFDFRIPEGEKGIQGIQGSKGDAGQDYNIDVEDLFVNRVNYDNQVKAFSFLAIDEGILYWKLSSATADWSQGVSFLSSEYILAMNRINKNILVNADIASSTATVNQAMFSGDLTALEDGDMLYDMWQKEGLEIYQTIDVGSFKLGTEYTKTRRVYSNGVLIESSRELIVSPTMNSSSWKINFKYDNHHYDAGTYIHVQMQVEEGTYATDFEIMSYLDTLDKCKRYYQVLDVRQAMPIVSDNLLLRKIQIPVSVHDIDSYMYPDNIDIVVVGGTIDFKECMRYSLTINATAMSISDEVVLGRIILKSGYYNH